MSSKNIYILNKSTYIQKNEQRLLRLSDTRFFDKYFLLGKGVDRDEMIFSTIFDSFLCERNCEINKLIDDKIAGKLEPQRKKKNPIIITKSGEEEEFLTDVYWDKDVEW